MKEFIAKRTNPKFWKLTSIHSVCHALRMSGKEALSDTRNIHNMKEGGFPMLEHVW
jgi:hypothetical protein